MSDTLTLAYCLQFQGEHYAVDDLIKITTSDSILSGRLSKFTSTSLMLDCSEQYNSKTVSVPIANIKKVSADLTIESKPMVPIVPPGEDVEPEPITVANVSKVDELIVALANESIRTINILNDITTTEKLIVRYPVVINGGGNAINFIGDAVGWNSNYVIQVYKTTGVTISRLKVTGGDVALLVNGAEVTLTGTIDVSGNEFGGVEVSQGSGVTNVPSLTVTGANFINTTEYYGIPTIWEDKVTGRVIGFTGTVTGEVKEGQVQYYTKAENAVKP